VSDSLAKSNSGCILSGCLFHGGIVLALAILWVAVGLPYGSYRLRATERAWAEGFLNESQYAARYPARAVDETARRLDQEARRMGTLILFDSSDRGNPPDVLQSARTYLGMLAKEKDGPVRVPPEVVHLVEERTAGLEAVEALLAANPSPSWSFNTGGGSLGLLGLRNVNALLVLRGLIAEQRNALPERDQSFEASWRLSESVHRSPVLIDRLLALALEGERNGGLRRLRTPGQGWTERLRAPRFAAVGEVYQAEVRIFTRGAAGRLIGFADLDYVEGTELPSVSWGGWIARLLTAPWVRLCVAGYSDTIRAGAVRMRQTNPCGTTPNAFADGILSARPSWNILSKIAAPSVLRSWIAFRERALDDELTAAVLDARGAWTGARPSDVCPGLQWVSERKGAGVTVTAKGAPLPAQSNGWPILAYTLAR
jgi:hypothetical protein